MEVKKLIESASTLCDALINERNAVVDVRAKLESEQVKVAGRGEVVSTREAAVLAREQAVSGIESANAVLAKAEDVSKNNRNLQKELDDRVADCKKVQKDTKDQVEKFERDRFDFTEAKRAHSVTRREFEEQKVEWQEKVDKLGINV